MTHLRDLSDAFPQTITVARQDGSSKILEAA